MNKKQKIAQCFSPAAFIHDTEENYQAIEKLIRADEIGGLTFFTAGIQPQPTLKNGLKFSKSLGLLRK